MATVLIPTPLRKFTGNQPKVTIPGNVIAEIITNMVDQYPEMQKYLLDPSVRCDPSSIFLWGRRISEVCRHKAQKLIPIQWSA